MTPLKLLLLLRLCGAGIIITLIGHQVANVLNIFGITLTSVVFLLPITIFYTLLYLLKFYRLHGARIRPCDLIKIHRRIDHTQLGLLGLSVMLAIVELLEKGSLTPKGWANIVLTIVFLVIADVVFKIIEDFYSDMDED